MYGRKKSADIHSGDPHVEQIHRRRTLFTRLGSNYGKEEGDQIVDV